MTMWKTVRNDFVNEYSINIKFFFPKRITTFFRSLWQNYELWILCIFCLLLRWLQNHMIWKYALLLIELNIFAEKNKKHSKTFAAICTPTKRIERNEIHILTYNKTWNDRKKTHSTGEKKLLKQKLEE